MTKAALLVVSLALLFVANLVAGNAQGQECGDVNGAGGITATDALIVLKKAVGVNVPPLVCPDVIGVPVTGQTTCYDAAGAETDCGGTGQDGEFQAGVMRGFTDNGDGTVTDDVTGLMWEKLSDDGSIHDGDDGYRWADAFAVKIATLNGESFAGYDDWRVPNRFELETLVDLGVMLPATYSVFDKDCTPGCTVLTCGCTRQRFFWSSTTHRPVPGDQAWGVSFADGGTGANDKSVGLVVRAVRGGS